MDKANEPLTSLVSLSIGANVHTEGSCVEIYFKAFSW